MHLHCYEVYPAGHVGTWKTLHLSLTPQSRQMGGAWSLMDSGWKQNAVSSREPIQARSTDPESFSEKLSHERLLFLDNNR